MEKITLQFGLPKIKFTTGDIICCESFSYGISMIDENNEVMIFNSEKAYHYSLIQYLKTGKGVDAYDIARGKALFLVLSMELTQTILPEDVDTNRRYIGLNVKCIRLENKYSLMRNAERIFFTLYHPMSQLDLKNANINVIDHLDLPIYWSEDYTDEYPEKPL